MKNNFSKKKSSEKNLRSNFQTLRFPGVFSQHLDEPRLQHATVYRFDQDPLAGRVDFQLGNLPLDELIFLRSIGHYVQTRMVNSFSQLFMPTSWIEAGRERVLTAQERFAINRIITGSVRNTMYRMRRNCGHEFCGDRLM